MLALAILPLIALIVGIPSTLPGWLALAACALACVIPAVKAPWRKRIASAAGGLACACTLSCLHASNRGPAHFVSAPSPAPAASYHAPAIESAPALGGALVDEETVAVMGARVVVATHRIPALESLRLVEVMKDGYRRMKQADGHVPTPVAAWMTGLQPDTIAFEPTDATNPSAAVVFLHGWGGSWTLPCWQVAQAARRIGALTLCPATRFEGDWWSEAGERVVRDTIAALRARGVRRVALVGLSNGGMGASLLAPRLRKDIDALVLISGASPDAGSSGIPTLVLHAPKDSMAPASHARAYAQRVGATYKSLEGTHFVLLERHEEAVSAMAEFFARQLR
jgi:pimeloyl-ACP methyl ester carboxylesterase